MTNQEQKMAANAFAEKWADGGKEDQHTQVFWLTLLRDVYGVENPEDVISFEKRVLVENIQTEKGTKKRIDGYIANTLVLIEQKDSTKSLTKKYSQSDKAKLDAYEQADRYGKNLNHNENPRWIVTCNFLEFRIYDMNRRNSEPEVIKLCDLPEMYNRLSFLVDPQKELSKQQQSISLGAGEIVGRLYDALLKQYHDPENPDSLKDLNKLCVRIVFCLYAEDARIFDSSSTTIFHDYLQKYRVMDKDALEKLFQVLDQREEQRDPYLNHDLAAFPYVNGGLFADENIEIPRLGDEVLDLILDVACSFNWSKISPTVFGAVFESTLNPVTRREGGMHYTSIENIHKVIDPLFLDGLNRELDSILARPKSDAWHTIYLREFHEKIGKVKFLDPACGSGNFLTETFLSLRRLENRVIEDYLQLGDAVQLTMEGGARDWVKVSIGQFYGIEINDFAVAVARTALWIADIQMLQETEDILSQKLYPLPLKSNPNIVEANALTYPWGELVSKDELNYIMGNPPFVGARMMKQGSRQKKEVIDIFGKIKDVQDLDYVTCWYKKAAEFIQNTGVEVAFVSTNSICQGAQVPILWDVMLNQFHVRINFAHKTFKWDSESTSIAAVHCVIVGFACFDREEKIIFADGNANIVEKINPYLLPGENQFVTAQKNAICDVPKMSFGNQPRDGGHFVISAEERVVMLTKEPFLEKWLRPYVGAEEFINGKERWCLWLKDVTPADVKRSKILHEKIEAVRKFRLDSPAKTTNGYASRPHLFAQITQPDNVNYLMVPSVSSEKRKYVPIDFLDGSTIASNAVQIIPNATLYHFGVLTSNVHMTWMRLVGGRLEMRYRYSKELVYNTFPWPTPTKTQREKVERTAKAILDARDKYANCTLADLYDAVAMYQAPELITAHRRNDRAVWEAYGKAWPFGDEEACVRWLMERYKEMTQ